MDSFWGLNPHSLMIIAEGYNIALKRQIEYQNTMAHIQGAYVVEALLATVGNMFSGRNSKKHEYPAKPYNLNVDNEKTEREKESQLELFKMSLTTAMNNFNLRQSNKQG